MSFKKDGVPQWLSPSEQFAGGRVFESGAILLHLTEKFGGAVLPAGGQ